MKSKRQHNDFKLTLLEELGAVIFNLIQYNHISYDPINNRFYFSDYSLTKLMEVLGTNEEEVVYYYAKKYILLGMGV